MAPRSKGGNTSGGTRYLRLILVASLVNLATLLLSSPRGPAPSAIHTAPSLSSSCRNCVPGPLDALWTAPSTDTVIGTRLFRLPFITSYLLLHLTGFLLHHALSTICNRKNASRAPSTPYTPRHRTPACWMPQSENDGRRS
ncbi:hypothetical protein C8R45DRAFT_1095169 [Mycena sanguinolenta]|nr:hypothetical protein C8R45DRAFT_1095169 [Mycena sanguinolenta]